MKYVNPWAAGALTAVLALAACVQPPLAPTIPVAPRPGKSFEAFANDQGFCQQYAYNQTAPSAAAANNQAVGTALLTTALGAGLGAAVGSGGWHGNAGRGAGIGAASGAVAGTALGPAAVRLRTDDDTAAVRHHVRPMHGRTRQPGSRHVGAAAGVRPAYGPPGYYGRPY